VKAQDIILRILQLRGSLPTFHIAKLAYLFDLACVQLFGEPRSGIHYRWWHYGPWGEDVDRAIGALDDAGEIKIRDHLTASQRMCHLHTATTERRPKLTKDEESILKYVVKRFGSMSTERLKDFVYSTPPMADAQRRGALYESLNLYERSGTPAAYYDPAILCAVLQKRPTKRLRTAEDVLAAIEAGDDTGSRPVRAPAT